MLRRTVAFHFMVRKKFLGAESPLILLSDSPRY
jgi:hypothetical protein